jgi:hypothetical protein
MRLLRSQDSGYGLAWLWILDQRVKDRTTHLAADYERLSAENAKLHQLIIEMRS